MNSSEKFAGIQFLRALAALLIVAYHSSNALVSIKSHDYFLELPFIYSRGYYAVDLFFAISGFIMCLVLRDPSSSTIKFYWRRFIRIYPLYWIFCLIAVIWYRAGLSSLGDYPGWDNIYYSLLIWPQPAFPVYAVGWSLEHEIIFYILAALIIPTLGRWSLFFILMALTLVSWFGADKFIFRNHFNFHLCSPQHIQFCAGILAYLVLDNFKRVPWWIVAVPGAILFVFGGIQFKNLDNYRVLVALGSSLLIIAAMRFDFGRYPRFARRAIHLGDLTYSLYLVHWVGLFALGIFSAVLPAWAAEPYRLAAILLIVAISDFVHRNLERPLINFGRAAEDFIAKRQPRIFKDSV